MTIRRQLLRATLALALVLAGSGGAFAGPNINSVQGLDPPGSKLSGNPVAIGGKDPSGNSQFATLDASKNLNINVAAGTLASITSNTNPSDVTVATSLVNLNDAATVTLAGQQGIGVELTGTWSGVVTFEGEVATTWVAVKAVPLGGGPNVATATANGSWELIGGGIKAFRARFSTATSGTVVCNVVATTRTRLLRVLSTDSSNVLARVSATLSETPSHSGRILSNGATPVVLIAASSGKTVTASGCIYNTNNLAGHTLQIKSTGGTVIREVPLGPGAPFFFTVGPGGDLIVSLNGEGLSFDFTDANGAVADLVATVSYVQQ